MEYHNSENQGSQESCDLNYQFPLDLDYIPNPVDMDAEHSNQSSAEAFDVELPLPPGSIDIELPPSLDVKNVSSPLSSCNKLSSTPLSKQDCEVALSTEHIPLPEDDNDKNISYVPPLPFEQERSDHDLSKSALDDSKDSPSKLESDEENQDFITIKPKVLGKEQAKKRLMAFSLSKQASAGIKKQNKVLTPAKSKEKPPNPNKGSGVQEQFRATISAIEEEKRKMMQNMPNYLLEMSELSKSTHPGLASSLQLSDKQKSDVSKDDKSSDVRRSKEKSKRNKRSHSRNRSPGRSSKRRRRSRSRSKRRSRSRSRRRSSSRNRKRSRSRSRRRSSSKSRSRRSHSRSRRSRSPRKSREEKSKSDKKENNLTQKKDLFEDWKSFTAAALEGETDTGKTKTLSEDLSGRRDQQHRRSTSPTDQPDFKPIFNYLKKGSKMTNLEAKPADPNNPGPVLFVQKTVKYTRTKPIISWAENPSHATEFYMSKQMLLENCDQTSSSILRVIMENKNKSEVGDLEDKPLKSRPWYPRKDYISPVLFAPHDESEGNELHTVKKSGRDGQEVLSVNNSKQKVESKEEIVSSKDDANSEKEKKRQKPTLERKISLVNDSYLSDEEAEVKEMIVGDVKVQLDLDMNRVKVRSKWDSDYEGENSEKEGVSHKRNDKELPHKHTEKSPSESNKKLVPVEMEISPLEKKESPSVSAFNNQSQSELKKVDVFDEPAGNLVSEYEEFLKMVSFDSNDTGSHQTGEVQSAKPTESKLEKQKAKSDKPGEEQIRKSSKIGLTDWDQESDEDKSMVKKIPFSKSDPHDEFLLLKEEKLDVKKKKTKKIIQKKKAEKSKPKKKKILKKSGKGKKSKYEDSSSGDSSSDSYESESDSESDDSISSKKKRKRKITKAKKKSRKESSSESESDSEDSKSKKKKHKKKKGGKKKKSVSSDSEEEMQSVLLKQLDFKKQLIMKKIEEIDSISERSGKKKEKENKLKKKEKTSSEEPELLVKSGKKKKKEDKTEKDKKKSKYGKKGSSTKKGGKEFRRSRSSSDSETESSDDSGKKKKSKKESKKKRDSSESSGSEKETTKGSKKQGKLGAKSLKSSNKSYKKNKKVKKDKKKAESSSESDSKADSEEEGTKLKRKEKKHENNDEMVDKDETSKSSWKENLLLDEEEFKSDPRRLRWGGRKLWKKSERKTKKKKDEDDWEANSSLEESSPESKARESSWDEEAIGGVQPVPKKDNLFKSDAILTERKPSENNILNISETTSQPVSETLKTSLSNFSFNENSFCSFGQELSRDFFLTERSLSAAAQCVDGENVKTNLIDARPFQSVSKDTEVKKPAESELYSPGYSDTDVSDSEINKTGKDTSANVVKEDVYDPLNCESEGSVENNEVELSSIPLPFASENTVSGENKPLQNVGIFTPPNTDNNAVKGFVRIEPEAVTTEPTDPPSSLTPLKSSFISGEFTPVAACQSPFKDDRGTPTKKQVIAVKGVKQILKSKAASVFQDESDEEESEQAVEKGKTAEPTQECLKEKTAENVSEIKNKEKEIDEKERDKAKKRKKDKENRERSRERSRERESRKRRSSSRERRGSSKSMKSPSRRRRSRTPEPSKNKEKREIRSDSFEIEPLKGSNDSGELAESIQPIPVLTGFGVSSSDRGWSRSQLPGYTCNEFSNNLIDHAESFDIYPSEDSKLRNRAYNKDYPEPDKRSSGEKSQKDERCKKEGRKSRSRSVSPRKKRRSKSPRRRSISPKRREKSPFSPRRRSPKRKSPSRRSRSSRSPDRRRKSRSRSPRKRRSSPSRRSRSISPRKYRSPKRRGDSPRRKDSPRVFSPKGSLSPRRSSHFSHSYSFHNRIPVIGATGEDMEVKPSSGLSPRYDTSMGFPRHLPESAMADAEMTNSFYDREYPDEFGAANYPEEIIVNNLITVKNHDLEKPNSPERLSLDQRIELELGVQLKSGSQEQSDQYQFQEMNSSHFQNSYNCDNATSGTDNFYQNQSMSLNPDFSGQYLNGHQQPPNYGSFQQYPNQQPVQSSVMQVGNIVEVVPTLQHPPPPPPPIPSKPHQIMQVGNVLQVVPSPKTAQASPVVPPASLTYGASAPPTVPLVKTQKATAVVAPSSIVPTPNPDAIINPLVKAIQLEREKRRKEKEKRKAEREARRKARQLRREAKLMSVNEKLKKSVQDEGLMLGQEVEDDEMMDGSDVPSPPIPVEIITVSSQSTLPPAGKGILITAGFMPKPPSEKKEVKFADGVCPGEGTSTSGGEDIASPPPKPKLPKEKRYRKKKTKVKKKVKVQIIRQIIQDEDDDDDDDLSPPPPPPGDPPPVFFARFPFAGDAQFPVYQTQTTTTTLTTVQYPAQSFQ